MGHVSMIKASDKIVLLFKKDGEQEKRPKKDGKNVGRFLFLVKDLDAFFPIQDKKTERQKNKQKNIKKEFEIEIISKMKIIFVGVFLSFCLLSLSLYIYIHIIRNILIKIIEKSAGQKKTIQDNSGRIYFGFYIGSTTATLSCIFATITNPNISERTNHHKATQSPVPPVATLMRVNSNRRNREADSPSQIENTANVRAVKRRQNGSI
jgi:hypothetical protein